MHLPSWLLPPHFLGARVFPVSAKDSCRFSYLRSPQRRALWRPCRERSPYQCHYSLSITMLSVNRRPISLACKNASSSPYLWNKSPTRHRILSRLTAHLSPETLFKCGVGRCDRVLFVLFCSFGNLSYYRLCSRVDHIKCLATSRIAPLPVDQ